MAVLIERYLQTGSLPWSLCSGELKEFRDTSHNEITHMFHLWYSGRDDDMSRGYISFLNEVWYKSDTQTKLKVRKVFQETFIGLRSPSQAFKCFYCNKSTSSGITTDCRGKKLYEVNEFLGVKRFTRILTSDELEAIRNNNKYEVQLKEKDGIWYEDYLTYLDSDGSSHNTNTNFTLKRQEAQEKIRHSAEESFKRKKISALALLGIVSVGFTLYQASQCVPEDESLMGQILGSIGIISRNVESSAFCSAVNWLRA